ncbi:PTS transporter subunit EIIB [Arcanobacterium haemolyticum]|nr:PTS transporter subunit EIIB [Arcanobacterium haemolyticum]
MMDIEAGKILAGLGGGSNVQSIEPCITRLRVEVADPQKVDEAALREAGVFGVVLQDSVVQVVVGPVADELNESLSGLL